MYKMRSTEKQAKHGGEFQDAVEVLPNADEVPEIGEELGQENPSESEEKVPANQHEFEQNSFKLPSSGRLIRNIDSAPVKSKRLWITPVQTVRLRRLLQVCLSCFIYEDLRLVFISETQPHLAVNHSTKPSSHSGRASAYFATDCPPRCWSKGWWS